MDPEFDRRLEVHASSIPHGDKVVSAGKETVTLEQLWRLKS
jgi:hypothetical protein